jgi:AbrB family looped-hinge helix DNA binding protein
MRKVGAKGQVVIDKRLRDKLGIGPGWIVVQAVVGDHIEMRFFPPEHNRSLLGILAPKSDEDRLPADVDWAEVKEKAWAAAVDQPKFWPSRRKS